MPFRRHTLPVTERRRPARRLFYRRVFTAVPLTLTISILPFCRPFRSRYQYRLRHRPPAPGPIAELLKGDLPRFTQFFFISPERPPTISRIPAKKSRKILALKSLRRSPHRNIRRWSGLPDWGCRKLHDRSPCLLSLRSLSIIGLICHVGKKVLISLGNHSLCQKHPLKSLRLSVA